MTAAEIITHIRSVRSLSNQTLSRVMERSNNMVIEYVKGRRDPPFSSVQRLMDTYHFSLYNGELIDLNVEQLQVKNNQDTVLEDRIQALLESKIKGVVDNAFTNMKRQFERKQTVTTVHRIQGTRY